MVQGYKGLVGGNGKKLGGHSVEVYREEEGGLGKGPESKMGLHLGDSEVRVYTEIEGT